MINNEIKTVLLAAMLPCLAPASIYTNAWDVDLPRNPPAVIDVWRGETAAALGAWEAEHGPHEDRNLWNVLATAEGLKWFDGRCDGAPDGLAGQLEGFGK